MKILTTVVCILCLAAGFTGAGYGLFVTSKLGEVQEKVEEALVLAEVWQAEVVEQ